MESLSEWSMLAPSVTYDSQDDKPVKEIGAEIFRGTKVRTIW